MPVAMDSVRRALAAGVRNAPRQAAMSVIHRFGQRVGNTSADPHHGGLLDAELHGDGVGGLEADAADVARQALRILRHHLNGIGTIGLENPHRPRRTDAMAVQEDHDFPHRLLLGPGRSAKCAKGGQALKQRRTCST
jgi:hypothetical protein